MGYKSYGIAINEIFLKLSKNIFGEIFKSDHRFILYNSFDVTKKGRNERDIKYIEIADFESLLNSLDLDDLNRVIQAIYEIFGISRFSK